MYSKQSNLLALIVKLTDDNDFITEHKKNSKFFTRNRIWTFKYTFLFICRIINKRIQSEIDDYFSDILGVSEDLRQATTSSFCQQRAKISYTAFESASDQLVEYYYSNFTFKKYLGYRLVAIDGSVYTLPRNEETIKEYGDNVLSDNQKWIKAQVSSAVDVLNNIVLKTVVGPYKESEQTQSLAFLDHLGPNNLYLFDRGYFGRAFLNKVANTQSQFCFRVQKNACSEVISFIASEKTDVIELIKVKGGAIEVRLSKVILDTGEEEYLVSSLLDQDKLTLNDLKKLYHMRWGVEEGYKDMKYAICIENFAGKKSNSIKQEIFASTLTYNLSMMMFKPDIDRIANQTGKKKLQNKQESFISQV